jgi:hypothetical protein
MKTIDEHIGILRASAKFHAWRPARREVSEKDVLKTNIMAAEEHYTPDELAALWGVSAETIRNVFRNEPGVLRVGQANGKKRKYILMRIPESIAERVHKRLSAVPQ